jgi:hypothetical protein
LPFCLVIPQESESFLRNDKAKWQKGARGGGVNKFFSESPPLKLKIKKNKNAVCGSSSTSLN